jgi:hypothetical protein
MNSNKKNNLSKNSIILLLGFFFCQAFGLVAQKGYEAGARIGLSQYYGDLNTTLIPKKPGIMAGLAGRYNFNTRVSAATTLNFATLGASDQQSNNIYQKNRNLDFKSNIFDWTTGIEFNFFEYIHGSEDYFFTPYVKLGFSVFSFNPKGSLNNTNGDKNWYELQPLGTEGQLQGEEYSKFSGGLTLGVGLKWDINKDYSFNVEMSTRKLFTDYLDDVSKTYPSSESLKKNRGSLAADLSDKSFNPDLGQIGRQRGQQLTNDTYSFISIGVMKYFGGITCPEISKNN